jgi:hypothetical protein
VHDREGSRGCAHPSKRDLSNLSRAVLRLRKSYALTPRCQLHGRVRKKWPKRCMTGRHVGGNMNVTKRTEKELSYAEGMVHYIKA